MGEKKQSTHTKILTNLNKQKLTTTSGKTNKQNLFEGKKKKKQKVDVQ